jgi:CRISPR-associated protein Cas1
MQLFLTTYGTYLHVKDALFELRIRHADGRIDRKHYAATKVTAIVFTVAGALSTESVILAVRHNVDILFSEGDGTPIGRVWHSRPGSTTLIRKQQLRVSIAPAAVGYVTSWLEQKMRQQGELLLSLKKHRKRHHDLLDLEYARINGLADKVCTIGEGSDTLAISASTLRGLEGTAGRHYFQALSKLMPKEYSFAGRSFRPAVDSFNAFLNYGYGVLYGHIERALLIAGIDPYTGFMHRDDYNHKSMVYDFIEPYRIHVDHVVFRLFSGKRVKRDHYTDIANGISLTKDGKQLLLEKLNDYLDVQKVRHRGRNLTRGHVIRLEAHRFANGLLGVEVNDLKLENI